MTELRDSPLRTLVETVNIALIAIDAQGHIVLSNPAAQRLFGYSSAELDGLPIGHLFPIWNRVALDSSAFSQDAETELSPVEGRDKAGDQLTLAAHITMVSDQKSDLRYTLVLRDISAELEAERLSAAEFQRMDHAVQGARIGIFDLNMVDGTSIVSGAWRELMEVAPEEDIDTQAEWRSRVHSDDLILVEQADRDCIEGRTDRSLTEYRMQARNGSGWRWMRSDGVAASRDEGGVATRLIGAQTDITDQKELEFSLRQSEERFRSAMAFAPIGKALVAPDGRWLVANPAMCRFLGYSEQELLSVDFQTITHPDDLAKDLEHVNRMLAGEDLTYSMEKRYLRPDGEIVWGLLSVSLVRDEKGAPLHFISQILDITERHRLERIKRDFTATVSHELRTPVTAIAAALDLIDPVSFERLPDKVSKLVSICRQNCDHLRVLLDDILDFERLSSEKMPVHPVNANVVEIVEQSIRITQPYADQHQVKLMLEAPDRTLRFRADPVRFQQVLTNLLSNAAKFSHEGGLVRIGVRAHQASVRISVADQGIGIPDDFHEKVFEPFSQVDTSDIRERRGTGLGLSISKQLTERMNGTIGFNSLAEGGTEFWVVLPAGR